MSVSGSKRGNVVVDIILIVVVLFVFALVLILSSGVFNDLNDSIQDDDDTSTVSKEMMQEQTDNFSEVWDYLFAFFFVGLWIGALVSAFFTDGHPVWFFVCVIGLIIVLSLVPILGNVYYDTVTVSDDYSDDNLDMGIVAFIMNYFLETIIVVGFTVMVAFLAKRATQ